MNLITDTWRGLVRRKLWPVALLLVGALVAVPLTLAKEPEVAPAPANLNAAAVKGLPATYVTDAAAEDPQAVGTTKRRRTLGAAKDPFEPAPLPKAKKKRKTVSVAKASSAKKSSSKKSSSSKKASSGEKAPASSADKPAGSGGGSTAPPVATAVPAATPKPAPLNSIRVRFSRVEEEGSTEADPKTVERLEVLPDEETPVLVYRGVRNGGKVAIFELTGDVTVEGDGTCEPTPEDCRYLELRAGETEFITVKDTGADTDAQYQLDLVRINAKK